MEESPSTSVEHSSNLACEQFTIEQLVHLVQENMTSLNNGVNCSILSCLFNRMRSLMETLTSPLYADSLLKYKSSFTKVYSATSYINITPITVSICRHHTEKPIMTILCNVNSNFGSEENKYELPSAPSPGLVLFNTEEQSDMIFNVGLDEEDMSSQHVWRFPVHSFVIADASPVFADVIRTQLDHYGSMGDTKPEIFIQCQPEIFQIVLSYIYKKELNIGSVSNCLSLVIVSLQFMLHDLCGACVTFLTQNASVDNVLDIISKARRVLADVNHNDDAIPEQIRVAFDELSGRCYSIVDANAEKILSSDKVDIVQQEVLIELLSRDTLRLASESTAFECLTNWACQQCLKRRLELVGENKRHVLGHALYTARYLVMSLDEFVKGPYSSDLLTDDEKSAILTVMKDSRSMLPNHLTGLKLDIARKFVKPTNLVSPIMRSKENICTQMPLVDRPTIASRVAIVNRKKNSASKKLLSGLSGIMICVIQLLD
ncbi:BTB/POZ domain-containing protein 6 [Halotydeus destructor]|nr:BTB/POZ domain-containing protein 6 [Halotydeus destructor]